MDADEERRRQAWQRLQREQQARALRFGPRPERPRDKRRKLEPLTFGAVSLTPPEEIEGFLETFLPVFGRRDTLLQAELYTVGLLSNLQRKNGETIEAAVPAATQQGVWDFLVRSPWSAEGLDQARVMDALRRLGYDGRPLDLVCDETGWVKKGQQSVGVARQYLGSIGKVDNGQVIVSLHGLFDQIDLPLLAELYLSEAWVNDSERRRQARIPEDRTFSTKPQIALALLDRVQGWGLTLGRMFGDPGYADLEFIQGLDGRNLPYCLGVKSTALFWLPTEAWAPAVPAPPYSGRGRPRSGIPAQPHLHSAAELRRAIPNHVWRAVAYRDGVDGDPLVHEFVAVRAHLTTTEQVRDGAAARSNELWLLVERELGGSDGLKQYVISGPETMSLDELAQLAHYRPIIERNSYENAKQEAGLDHYQGRSWVGLHHHLSMVWLALTFLMLCRQPLPPPTDTGVPDLLPEAASPEPASPGTEPLPPAQDITRFTSVALPAPAPLPRPRQTWESVQEVRRRFVEWVHGMCFRELTFAGIMPPLPVIGFLPNSP